MFRCGSSQQVSAAASKDLLCTGSHLYNERNVQACSTSYGTIQAYAPRARRVGRLRSVGGEAGRGAPLLRTGGGRPHVPCGATVGEVIVLDDAASLEHQLQDATPKKKHVPWNKGLTVSEHTKRKISNAQKLRWSRNPEMRQQVASKLKGKVPWNKGRTMSEETRAKMRDAKLNRPLAKAVRHKMSKSHRGKSHTAETAALLSAKLAGKPKSAAHRLSIGAAQRRRGAAVRVLRAVEEVHRECEAEGKGTPQLPPSVSSHAGKSGKAAAKGPRKQLLEVFKCELREYRLLQDELAPWTRAFEAKAGRKPRLRDVELSGVEWLLHKYRKYVVLRERVLSDSASMRRLLEGAKPDAATKLAPSASSAARPAAAGGATSNGAAARIAAALEYKRARGKDGAASEPVPTLASAAAGTGDAGTTLEGVLAAVSGADRATGANVAAAAARPLPNLTGTNAPPRVKTALLAAMEYREQKAAATAARANAAAVAALQPRDAKPAKANGGAVQPCLGEVLDAANMAAAPGGSGESIEEKEAAARQAAVAALREAAEARRSVQQHALQDVVGLERGPGDAGDTERSDRRSQHEQELAAA